MKENKNVIYIIIIIILVAVICCGGTYLFMSNKDNKTSDEDNKANEPIKNDNTNKESVTLSNSELEEYLKYIPHTDQLDLSVYLKPTNANQLDINALIYTILENIYADSEGDIDTLSYIETRILMKKMYNLDIPQYQNKEDVIFQNGCRSLIYNNNEFQVIGGCGLFGQTLGVINSYEANNNELLIYENAVFLNGSHNPGPGFRPRFESFNEDKVPDLTNEFNKICEDTGENLDYIEYIEDKNLNDCLEKYKEFSINYFKEHKNEFTKYKHTFKKNETGYYWYSTEVA